MSMRMTMAVAVLAACMAGVTPAAEKREGGQRTDDVSKWDKNMAVEKAADVDGVRWIDGKALPLEGRAFADTEHYYDRLPANVTTNVNEGVRNMKHHTSGMQFRFRTDSDFLDIRWIPYRVRLGADHMAPTSQSGIDVYRFDSGSSKWRYVKTGRIVDGVKGGALRVKWRPGDACVINLPLYNGIKEFRLGIGAEAKIEPLPPRANGVDRPVVFYGTSITHGACASRPGLAFVNRVGRDLDVPVVNLGFSGSGIMEYEMSEHLAAIEASCYVLDCVWNMRAGDPGKYRNTIEGNYEPFIRNLRAKRPDVPIVMAEACDVYCGEGDYSPIHAKMNAKVRAIYEKLIAEGWKGLHYLPKDGMYSDDYEGAMDGIHPNDLGMKDLSLAYGKAVREALGL